MKSEQGDAPKKRLTKSQIAERYQCSDRTIDRRLKEGEFPKPIRVGRLLRWRLEDIISWEESQE